MSDEKSTLTLSSAAKPQPVPPKRSGETVTVACKTPNGLILRVFDMVPEYEQVMGGGNREVKVARQTGDPVVLNGNTVDPARTSRGEYPEHQIVGGYALTPGVSRDFWERWLAENKSHPAVLNGLVFAHGTEAAARDQARDGAKLKSGLEPIDPEHPAAKIPGGSNIQRGDRPAA